VAYLYRIISRSRWIALAVLVVGTVHLAGPVLAHDDVSSEDKELAASVLRAIDVNKGVKARNAITRISNPLLQKTLLWLLYTEVPGAANWSELATFIDDNPGWPRLWTLRKNLEEVMSASTPLEQVGEWFAKHPPVSARGKGLLIKWLLSEERVDEAVTLIRHTWINGDFARRDEKWFYRSYRKHLTKGDHEARLDRLLWDGANWSARRMFSRVNNDLRMLAEARYLLRHRRGNVDAAIARVPAKYLDHAGLVYERLRWRRRKGKDTSARSMLDDDLGEVPHPDLWFKEREVLARRALSQGLVSVAYDLVHDHGLTTEHVSAYASAEWMSGWIALRFLNEPEWAFRHFTAMYDAVRFPISVARASYWAGRAASAMQQEKVAKTWFNKAVIYPTTFYGQLAASALFDSPPPLQFTEYTDEDARKDTNARLEASELTQAVHLLVSLDAQDRMRPFLQHLIDAEPGNGDWQVAVGTLAKAVGRTDFGVRVAKAAVHNGMILPDLGYPIVDLPTLPKGAVKPGPEHALVYSLIRQESAYYVAAKSSAGARGLMQLMPATAQVVSRNVGMEYSKGKLTADPAYNLKLGQAYLSSVIDRYDGSYVLALSAYNAGPRRAKAWIKAHGDPREAGVDVVDWVELIPFDETRNYVQRVMESLQVYRARLDPPVLISQLAHDLVR
jgi:soluble lytic murein transglycosylase